jgi:two-component system nitrogen regulation sensor histidine kinase NtrY
MSSAPASTIAVRAAAAMGLAVALGAVAALASLRLGAGEPVALLVALGLAVPAAFIAARLVVGRRIGVLRAVSDGLAGLAEDEHALRVRPGRRDEVGELALRFNALGDALRARHSDLHQRELLLQTVIEAAPMAILLVDDADRVVLANAGARQLLGRADLQGHTLAGALEREPPELREAVAAGADALLTLERAGAPLSLHVARRTFHLDTRAHTLVLLRTLTREIARREALTYKNAVRLINHELNNSMAPLSSLLHSARLISERWAADDARAGAEKAHAQKLAGVLDVVQERTAHLKSFLEGYAELARLPPPQPREVAWRPFLETVRGLYPFQLGELPADAAHFDPSQVQQLVINLVKNAIEAGSAADDIVVSAEIAADGATEIRVADRGEGASDEVLQKAMLPFYSAKEGGLGVGLALCREIATAHGGDLVIRRRDDGVGLIACCWLPGQPSRQPSGQASGQPTGEPSEDRSC